MGLSEKQMEYIYSPYINPGECLQRKDLEQFKSVFNLDNYTDKELLNLNNRLRKTLERSIEELSNRYSLFLDICDKVIQIEISNRKEKV